MASKFISKIISKNFNAGFLSFVGYEVGVKTHPQIIVANETKEHEEVKELSINHYLTGLCIIVFVSILFVLFKEVINCVKQSKEQNNNDNSSRSR